MTAENAQGKSRWNRERFTTTHWSVVLLARDPENRDSQTALAELCEAYWYPLYAFVRRQGYPPEDAEDLTQEFFCRMFEKNFLESVDPERGRFRSFLLVCLKHFLAKERDKVRAIKRGGGHRPLPLDFDYAEGRYRHEPAHGITPEKLFERSWAELLLSRVLKRLQREYEAAGKSRVFDALQEFLDGDRGGRPYAELAAEMGLSESGIKMTVMRMRRRYGELLRREITPLLADPADFEEEMRHLLAALE